MEAVGRLHDLRDLSHLERHGGVGEGRPEDRLGGHAQLAALGHAARILRIEPRQRREALPVHDALAQADQLLLDGQLGRFLVGIQADLADPVFGADHRKVFRRGLLDIFLDVTRGDFRNVLRHVALHLLDERLVAQGGLPLLAELVERFAEILFGLLFAAEGHHHLVHALLEHRRHLGVVDDQRVETGLRQEKLRDQEILKNLAAGGLVDRQAAGALHLGFRLDFGEHHDIVSDQGDGLVDDAVVFLAPQRQDGQQQQSGCKYLFHLHNQNKHSACSKSCAKLNGWSSSALRG